MVTYHVNFWRWRRLCWSLQDSSRPTSILPNVSEKKWLEVDILQLFFQSFRGWWFLCKGGWFYESCCYLGLRRGRYNGTKDVCGDRPVAKIQHEVSRQWWRHLLLRCRQHGNLAAALDHHRKRFVFSLSYPKAHDIIIKECFWSIVSKIYAQALSTITNRPSTQYIELPALAWKKCLLAASTSDHLEPSRWTA